MIERSNLLNDIYQRYDTGMNNQHSIDFLHPPPLIMNMPSSHPVNPQIKTTKEERENDFLNVSNLFYFIIVMLFILLINQVIN